MAAGPRAMGALRGRLGPRDGGGLVADLDGDAPRLALLGLGDAYLEHALVEGGCDPVGVDAVRQRQRAAELAEGALHPVEALLLLLVLGLPLAGDGQDVVLELDRDVLLREAGQVGAQDEVLVGLDEVHGRHPAADAAAVGAGRRGIEERVEQPVHLTLKRAQLANGLPANKGHFVPPELNAYRAGSSMKSQCLLVKFPYGGRGGFRCTHVSTRASSVLAAGEPASSIDDAELRVRRVKAVGRAGGRLAA